MKVGLICGNFDVIHPGYIQAFKEMKKHVDTIWVLQDNNDFSDRPEKLKPILSVQEREQTLLMIKGVDNVIHYKSEKELQTILNKIQTTIPQAHFIRFLGEDYINRKDYTGYNTLETMFIQRNHNWSTTKFKTMIGNSLDK